MSGFPISEEIIVTDNNYVHQKVRYKEIGAGMQEILDKYVAIINAIVSEKCLEGETARSLTKFAELVSMMFGDSINAILDNQRTQMPEFVRDIDEADRKLF